MKKVSLSIGFLIAVMFVVNIVYTIDTTYPVYNPPTANSSLEDQAEEVLKEIETESSVALVKTTTPDEITSKVSQANIHAEGAEAFFNTKPNSLKDVPAPSALEVDTNGMLVVDHRVKTLFEHYLSGMGEESLDNVILRIKYDLSNQLNGPALDEGIALLEGYLQYRNHLGILKNDHAQIHEGSAYNLESVKAMKQTVKEARYSFFDDQAINGLFSQEDEYDDYMMSRAVIQANPGIDQSEKSEALSQLEDTAPIWISQNTEKSNRFANTRTKTQSLRNAGGSDEEIYQLREVSFGAEAAERLNKLDLQRQQWQEKLRVYRIELDSFLAGASIDDFDQGAIDELRSEHFSGPDMTRVKAIDKIQLGI